MCTITHSLSHGIIQPRDNKPGHKISFRARQLNADDVSKVSNYTVSLLNFDVYQNSTSAERENLRFICNNMLVYTVKIDGNACDEPDSPLHGTLLPVIKNGTDYFAKFRCSYGFDQTQNGPNRTEITCSVNGTWPSSDNTTYDDIITCTPRVMRMNISMPYVMAGGSISFAILIVIIVIVIFSLILKDKNKKVQETKVALTFQSLFNRKDRNSQVNMYAMQPVCQRPLPETPMENDMYDYAVPAIELMDCEYEDPNNFTDIYADAQRNPSVRRNNKSK